MKTWLSRITKLATVLVLLSLFSTLAFAKQEMVVESVRLEDGVEVEWGYLEAFKGMNVWCAAYDKHGRVIAIGQADMDEYGKACRLKCNPKQVEYVKLFLLDEDIKPAEDVDIPGQKYDPNDPSNLDDHLCMWELQSVVYDNGYLEEGLGQFQCPVCKETKQRAIPAQANPEERALVARAEELGLLQYLELEDLDDATRLDLAMLVPIVARIDHYDNILPSDTCKFPDCADLSDQEKGVLNSVSGFIPGNENGNLVPYAGMTRAEVAYVLYRCMGFPYPQNLKEYSDVPEGVWYYEAVNVLYSLGILDDSTEFRPTDKATVVDLLKWAVNADEWADQMIDRMKPSNLRFENRGQTLSWNGSQSGLWSMWYNVGMQNANTGKWETIGRAYPEDKTDGNYSIPIRWRHAGQYQGFNVCAETEFGRPYGNTKDMDMTMTVRFNEFNPATVTVVEADGGKVLKITGMPANRGARVMLSGDGRFDSSNHMMWQQADGNGEMLWKPSRPQDAQLLEGEFWYVIEDFSDYNLSADGKNLTYTVFFYGEGHIKPTPVIPGATADQQALVERANNAGLLEYIDLTDLGGVTRLDAAKLLMAMDNYKMGNGSSLAFTDIGNLTQQEKDIIAAMLDNGFMAGTGASTFVPDGTVSNAQFLLMLYRVMGEPNGHVAGANWPLDVSKQMTSLGILQNGDPDVTANATKESALIWMLRVKDWQENNSGGGTTPSPTVEKATIYAANGILRLDWPKKDGYTGAYYVNGTRSNTNTFYHLVNTVRNAKTAGDYSFTVETTQDNGATLTEWAQADNILHVVFDQNQTPDVSIVGQANGSYKFIPNDGFTGAYDFTMYSPEGVAIRSWYVGANATTSVAPYDGCYFTVRELGWALGTGLTDVTATVSGTKQFGFTPYDHSATTVRITADDESALTAALNAGGTVILDSDVTITNSTINQGSEVSLDLNGHTIDIGSSNSWGFTYGKKITIMDNSADRSGKIVGRAGISVYGCADVTVRDIAVERLYASDSGGSVRNLDLKKCRFTYQLDLTKVEDAALEKVTFDAGAHVNINNSSAVFTDCVLTGRDQNFVMSLSGTSDVEFNDVSVSAAAMYLNGGTLTINSGSYTDSYAADNLGLFRVNPGAEVVIKGGSFNFDPSAYVDENACTVSSNGGIWEVQENSAGGAYAVSNIRFEETDGVFNICWDAPNTTEKLKYKVYALSDETGMWEAVSAISNTSKNYMSVGFAGEGDYTQVKIVTELNRVPVAETVTKDLTLCLVREMGSDAVASFAFDESENMYEWTIGNLLPNTQYAAIDMNFDLTSKYTTLGNTVGRFGTVQGSTSGSEMETILTSGYYLPKEYSDYVLSPDGRTLNYTVHEGKEWKAFFTSYGYVTEIRTELGDKGDLLDYVTFEYEGVTDTIQAKHQYTGVLSVGDYFSYRLHLKMDGERRMSDIEVIPR